MRTSQPNGRGAYRRILAPAMPMAVPSAMPKRAINKVMDAPFKSIQPQPSNNIGSIRSSIICFYDAPAPYETLPHRAAVLVVLTDFVVGDINLKPFFAGLFDRAIFD